jgi:hypothetical protein
VFFVIGITFLASESNAEIVSFELYGTASLRTDGFRPIEDGSAFVAKFSYERNVPRSVWVPNPDGEQQPPPPDYQGPLSAHHWYNGLQFLVEGRDAEDDSEANVKHWFDVTISVDGLRIHGGPFEPAAIGMANDIPGNGDPMSGGDFLSVLLPGPTVWPEEFRAEVWRPGIQMYWWDPTGQAFEDTSVPTILRPGDFENPYIIIGGSSGVCAGDYCPSWSIWARIESVTPIPEPSCQIVASVASLLMLGGAFLRRIRRRI